MSVATLPDTRCMTDDELAGLIGADDDTMRTAAIAELDRRERAARARSARRVRDTEWADAAHAQYLEADAACRGNLLSRRGLAAGVTEWSLWRGPEHVARAYASEELGNWWDEHGGRITVTEWRNGQAADRKDEHETARAETGQTRQEAPMHFTTREPDKAAETATPPRPPAQKESVQSIFERNLGALRSLRADRAASPPQFDGARLGTSAPLPGIGVETFGEIESLPTVWWWRDRLARGWLTMFAGAGAVGKGRMICDLVARFTRGWPAPGDGPLVQVNEPGYVVLVLPEDDPNEEVAGRLEAAGADRGRVYDFTFLPDGSPFELPECVPHLRALVDQLRRAGRQDGEADNPVMVVIDPLMAVTTGPVSSNHGARRVMAPLMRMVRETGVVGVMCHHTTKDGKKLFGSAGLEQVLRCVYMVTLDAADPAIRVISLRKGNNTAKPEDVRYTIAGPEGAAQVIWLSRDEMAARRKSWRQPGKAS